jgi:hypothetical protein
MDNRQLCLLIHSALADKFPEDIPTLLSRDHSQALLERLVIKLISLAKSDSPEIAEARLKDKLHRPTLVDTRQTETFLKSQVFKLKAAVKELEETAAEQTLELKALVKENKSLHQELLRLKAR